MIFPHIKDHLKLRTKTTACWSWIEAPVSGGVIVDKDESYSTFMHQVELTFSFILQGLMRVTRSIRGFSREYALKFYVGI